MVLWCDCVYSMNTAESTSTAEMRIRLRTLSDSDYIICYHSRKTNQRCVTVECQVYYYYCYYGLLQLSSSLQDEL